METRGSEPGPQSERGLDAPAPESQARNGRPARSRAYKLQSWSALLVLVGIVAVVGYNIYTNQRDQNSQSPQGTNTPTTTPAQDAAAMLQAYDAADGHPGALADYQAAFDRVAAKCTNTPTDLGHFIANSKNDLVLNHVTDETELSLMRHLDESIPAGTTMECQSVLAAYLVLREG